jgi:hypothetical protein
MTLNTTTGVFTLTANKTYRLFGSVGFVNFSSATGWFVYQWVDATTNTALDTTGISDGVAEALNRDVSEFNATSANLIYTPSTNQTIKLRITDGNGTVSIRSGIGTKATIEQINPTVTVNDGSSGSSGTSGSNGSSGTSGFVNAGVDVTLGNLKARIPTTGNRSLQIATVTSGTTYSVYGSAISVFSTNALGSTTIDIAAAKTISTTPTYLNSGNTFAGAGGVDTWNIMDTTNLIAWRVSCIIGGSYNNNLITIERLY